jgi:hypothetical protein
MAKLMPSTAFTQPKVLANRTPLAIGKYFFSFSTVKRGSDIMPAPYTMISGKLYLRGEFF